MIKSAESISINTLLSENKNRVQLIYKIPPYQREYAWGKEQWENLFDDIQDNEIGYFLGSIICIEKNNYFEVIDGQQRLTTLSILLCSILNTIIEYDETYPDERILDNRKNRLFSDMWSNLENNLYCIDKNTIRFTPSIQNENKNDYEYLISCNISDEFISTNKYPRNFGNRRISKAYEYFKTRLLDNELQVNSEKININYIFDYLKKITSSLLVKIDVDSISSAFTLFESINNRGIPLTPIDLIKNSIIGKINEIYNENPNDINNKWQNIVNNIESYEDQVRFLRHYYHAFQNEKNINIKPFVKATKSNIIKIYSKHIDSDVKFIFNELIEKSTIYNQFVHPENLENNNLKEQLIDLQRLGVSPAYSLLLYIFSIHQNENIPKLLNFIENWFIRRHLTDFPATNKLDQIFIDLINKIHSNGYNFEEIKTFLIDENRFIHNDKLKDLLLNGNLYEINTGATRCLLTKLEKSKRTDEIKVDFWELTGEKKQKLVWSIEHIMPQHPKINSDWMSIEESQRNKFLHKLGNLTLTCYNSNLSNNSFKEKTIIKNKLNQDIGLKSGNVKINQFIKEKNTDEWNIEDIISRGKILTDEILELLNKI